MNRFNCKCRKKYKNEKRYSEDTLGLGHNLLDCLLQMKIKRSRYNAVCKCSFRPFLSPSARWADGYINEQGYSYHSYTALVAFHLNLPATLGSRNKYMGNLKNKPIKVPHERTLMFDSIYRLKFKRKFDLMTMTKRRAYNRWAPYCSRPTCLGTSHRCFDSAIQLVHLCNNMF